MKRPRLMVGSNGVGSSVRQVLATGDWSGISDRSSRDMVRHLQLRVVWEVFVRS